MQKVMGYMRRAILDYNMIEDGDRIAVGVSGGKDSMVLLSGLAGLRRFLGRDFSLVAITLEMGFPTGHMDFSPITEYCKELGIEHVVRQTRIGDIVFDERKEKSPCSLCAKMRRGILHEETKKNGCNKLAMGHHMDDAIETFLMNLSVEARIACFQPVSYLSIRDITMIRPMIYMPEKEAIRVANQGLFPVVKTKCPIDGTTKRQDMKDFIKERESLEPGFKKRIFHAMKEAHVSDW